MLARCELSREANGLQGRCAVRHDPSMKLDGSRIDSAWLGACLDLENIATAISASGKNETLSLMDLSMRMNYVHTRSGQ